MIATSRHFPFFRAKTKAPSTTKPKDLRTYDYNNGAKKMSDSINTEQTEEIVDNSAPQAENELATLKEEMARVKEQLQRVAAESENFRRRQEANFEKRLDSAKDDLVRRFLPFIDNLEMALKASQEKGDYTALASGVELVHKNVLKVLSDLDIKPIEAMGATFDPTWHEAVMMEQREDVADETIVAEFTRGYRCGDRVIRPSMVKVARNS